MLKSQKMSQRLLTLTLTDEGPGADSSGGSNVAADANTGGPGADSSGGSNVAADANTGGPGADSSGGSSVVADAKTVGPGVDSITDTVDTETGGPDSNTISSEAADIVAGGDGSSDEKKRHGAENKTEKMDDEP